MLEMLKELRKKELEQTVEGEYKELPPPAAEGEYREVPPSAPEVTPEPPQRKPMKAQRGWELDEPSGPPPREIKRR